MQSMPIILAILAAAAAAYQSPFLGDYQVFPSDNPWHWDISGYDVHPNSANFVASVGANVGLHPDFGTVWDGAPMGIPYTVVSDADPLVPVDFVWYGDESDDGPYRIPLDAPVEGGADSDGDRHVIAVDTSNDSLYELYYAIPQAALWEAGSGAIFNLASNDYHPDTWTSADAAGLPIFPGLVRYEEAVVKGEIDHAIRMTVRYSQNAYIFPASHCASESTNPNHPPMGLRFRLKAGFDISGFSPACQVILRAMKKYGMIVADNGSDWYISGAPDERWNDEELSELKSVKGNDFEAVLTVDAQGEPIYPSNATVRQKTIPSNVNASINQNQRAEIAAYDIRGKRACIRDSAYKVPAGLYIVKAPFQKNCRLFTCIH